MIACRWWVAVVVGVAFGSSNGGSGYWPEAIRANLAGVRSPISHDVQKPEAPVLKLHISTARSRIRENSETSRRENPFAQPPYSHEFGYGQLQETPAKGSGQHGILSAMDASEFPAVEAGAEGLRDAARFPWYDAEADRLRPVRLPPYEPLLQPSDWNWQPPNPQPIPRGRWWWLKWVAAAFLAFLLFLILFFLLRALIERYRPEGAGRGGGDGSDGATEADRIESLPFRIERPQTNLLAEARRHYLAGDYGEAMIYLFSYQLVQLDKRHLIRLARGKTNRQYLRELRTSLPLRSMLSSAMVAFEDVFFGHHPLSRERFEACWNRLDEFHRLIQLPLESA